jgi:ElaB/YqjD/DUF883 family membrane-anchored ribosome-binding protein
VAQESFDSLTPKGPQLAQDKPFDSLTRRTANQLAQDRPSGSADTDQIKSEIEKTRAEMSDTLGEIQDRLRPDHLLAQARENVTQAAAGKVRTIMHSAGETASNVATRARGAGEYLADYAAAHPIRIAVTIGALTWLMLRSRHRSYEWYGTADTQWDDDMEDLGYNEGRSASLRDTVGDYAASARETVGEFAQSARETVGSYAASAREAAAEAASQAREAAGEYAESARSAARRASTSVRSAAGTATTSVDQWVHDNPLAAGAIALAVGAAIGMSVPRTDIEDSAMGSARDRAMEKASRLAQNVTDKVATAAENLVGESIMNASATTPIEPMGRA